MDSFTENTETVDPQATTGSLIAQLRGLQRKGHDTVDSLRIIAGLGLLLLRHKPAVHTEALNAGALPLLVDTLRSQASGGDLMLHHRITLTTLLLLIQDDTHTQGAAVHMHLLPTLVDFLSKKKSNSVKVFVTMILSAIVRDSEANRVALLQAGGFLSLHRLVREGYGAESDHARRLLNALVAHNDAARAITQLEALNAGIQIPASRPHLSEDHVWSTSEMASDALTQYTESQSDTNPMAACTRLVHTLRDHPAVSTPAILFALEDLQLLVVANPSLATTATAAFEDVVVPRCLTYLRENGSQTGHLYAASILMNVIEHSSPLRAKIARAGADGVDELAEMIDNGNHAAVFVLCGLLQAEDGAAVCLAAVSGGAVPLVVRVVRESHRPLECMIAASVLRILVNHDAAAVQTEALDAGAIRDFLGLLRRGGHGYGATRNLLATLQDLTDQNPFAQDAFVDADGAAVVAGLVASTEADGTVAAAAADAIVSLVTGRPLIQDAFTETGVVELLIDQLARPTGIQPEAAASALSALVKDHAANKAALLKGPAIDRLVALLRGGSTSAKLSSAVTVYHTTQGDGQDSATAQAVFAEAGAIGPLVRLLHERQRPNLALLATAALGRLVRRNQANQTEAVSMGAIAPLITTIRDGPQDNIEIAATTLADLVGSKAAAPVDGDEEEAFVSNWAQTFTMLADLLKSPLLPTADKSQAALVLGDFVLENGELLPVAVEAGAMEALVSLAQSTAVERACFVRVLAGLIGQDTAARALAADSVDVLVDSVNSVEDPSATRSALDALLCFAQLPQPDAVETILHAGLLHGIGRLLDQETSSAHAITLLVTILSSNTTAAFACWDTDVVASVVRLVERSSGFQQVQALCVIFKLLVDENATHRIREMLPLDVLLRALEDPVKETKMMTIYLILILTDDDVAQRARVVEAGGVKTLTALLQEEAMGPMGNSLFAALSWLVGDNRAVVDADTITMIRGFLDSSHAQQKMYAATALASIADIQEDTLAWGVLEPVMEMLKYGEDHDGDVDSRAVAANAIAYFVDGHTVNQTAAAAAGAIPALLDLIRATETNDQPTSPADRKSLMDAQRWAVRALANLVRLHSSNTMAAVHEGVMPWLTRIVRSPDHGKIRLDGVRAIRWLLESGRELSTHDERFVRAAAVEAGAVAALTALLETDSVDDQTDQHTRAALVLLQENPPIRVVVPGAEVSCVPPHC